MDNTAPNWKVSMQSDIRELKLMFMEMKADIVTMKSDIRQLNDRMDRNENESSVRFTRIEGTLRKLEGFQRNEADSIEFELRKIVEKYLMKKYAHMTIKTYALKNPKHPYTNKQLTDLDAAFLLVPYVHKVDHERMKSTGISYRAPEKGNMILAIAEAKHHMTKDKIVKKLAQFNIIYKMIWLAKRITENPDAAHDRSTMSNGRKITSKFIKTIERSEFQYINDFILFFGAAYWEKGILDDFEKDVATYKELAAEFEATGDQGLLQQASALEGRWTNEASDAHSITGAMRYVQFIYPSGERYSISHTRDPAGITTLGINGGSKR
jgi:hypothetical protein